MEVLYSINGVSHRPDKAEGIKFHISFTDPISELELGVNRVTLNNQAYDELNRFKSTQGFHEGIPYDITIRTPLKDYTLNYFIDLTENAIFRDSDCEVTVRKRNGYGAFMDQADGLSYEALNLIKPITGILDVKYIIQRDDQEAKLITLILASIILTKALNDQLKALADILSEIGSGIGAIAGALKAIYMILYTIALVASLIKMVKDIMGIIFPLVRTFKANTVQNLIKQGVEYLDYRNGKKYKLSSTLLQEISKMTVLPVPLQKVNKSIFLFDINSLNKSFTKGYPTALDTTPTVGSLIRAVCTTFNAVVRIIDGVVHIERKYYWKNLAGTTIHNTLSLQATRENQREYNTGDTWKRYELLYRLDPSDVHTLDNVSVTDSEWSTDVISPINADLKLVKGLQKKEIPFSYGIPKRELSFVEKRVQTVAKLADNVINTLGGNSNLQSLIEGRIGVLQISQQHYTVTKLLWIQSGKIPTNYENFTRTGNILAKYHTTNKVKENFKRIESTEVPFSNFQFDLLYKNNFVKDSVTGNELEILNFDWSPELASASIEYAVSASNEAKNIKTTVING
jgi:hypothetical protein